MSSTVITVSENSTVHELAHLLNRNKISGAPVVNHQGELVGVVSLTDIVENDHRREKMVARKDESDYYLRGWEDQVEHEEFDGFQIAVDDGLKVKDIMTPTIHQVAKTAKLSEMAEVMIDARIHRLFVTENNKIAGVVSTLDILTALKNNGQLKDSL